MATSRRKFYGNWLKTAFSGAMNRARAIWFGASILLALAPLVEPRVLEYRYWLAFLAPVGIVVGYHLYRLLRAPWDMHLTQDLVLEAKRDEIEKLTNRLTDYTNHQELADELTKLHLEACQELIDKGPDNLAAPDDKWILDALDWEERGRALFEKYNCSFQEWNRFQNVNSLDLETYKGFRNQEVAKLIIQVDRIGEISAEHAKRAEALQFAQKIQ